jgi:hypothetical protein
VREAALDAPQTAAIFRGNARRLLGET